MQALVSYLQGKWQYIAHKELKYSSFSTLNLTKSLKGLNSSALFTYAPHFLSSIVVKYAVEINSSASPATCQT